MKIKKLVAALILGASLVAAAPPALAGRGGGFHGGFHGGSHHRGRFHHGFPHGFRDSFFPGFALGVFGGAVLTAPWWYAQGYYAPAYPYAYPPSTCYTHGGQWVWDGAQWVWQPC